MAAKRLEPEGSVAKFSYSAGVGVSLLVVFNALRLLRPAETPPARSPEAGTDTKLHEV